VKTRPFFKGGGGSGKKGEKISLLGVEGPKSRGKDPRVNERNEETHNTNSKKRERVGKAGFSRMRKGGGVAKKGGEQRV